MEYTIRQAYRTSIFVWLYAMTLGNALHYFSTQFIHSSLLSQHLSQTGVSVIFTVASLLTLIILGTSVLFLSRVGAFYTALTAVTIDLVASLGLAYATHPGWVFVHFTLVSFSTPLTLLCIDVLLENYTKEEGKTGFVRGVFLAVSMTASLFAPVISGWLVHGESFKNVYLLSALYLVPVLTILMVHFKNFKDPHYELLSLRDIVNTLKTRKNVFRISLIHFLLRFYFSWTVIFLPLYLFQTIGFSWFEIGTILFLMVIPYILIEFPAGIIADKWLGEKELLLTGFFIITLGTVVLSILDEKSVLVWGSALFVTRIGAALIESMTETYFFKKIKKEDVSMMSLFHMVRSFAHVCGPLLAGIALLVVDIRYLWCVLAVIISMGIPFAYALKDTR